MSETLRAFCDRTDRETWQGASSAFRAGAKAALTGAECNYLRSKPFSEAWFRGHEAMLAHLKAGAVISTGAEFSMDSSGQVKAR